MTTRLDAAAVRSPHVVVGSAYAVAMAAVAALAAWPIYADARMLLLASLAVAGALVVSVAATLLKWAGWLTALAAVGVFLVLGVGVAVPPSGERGVVGSVVGALTGVITGFKDLVTVELPVGGYRNLLVPALAVFLIGTLVTLRVGWRPERWGALAAAAALLMPTFGLLFGRTVTSAPVAIGPVTVPAPRELACGVLALVLSVFWLSWRAASARRAALRRAAGTSGVRLGHRSGADLRRAGLAAGMVVISVAVGALIVPSVAEGRTRDVLRSAAGPAQAISRAVSPLTAYRANFESDAFRTPLFTVTAVAGPLPERVRLATLTSYDGAHYRVAASGDSSFVRVPSRLRAAPGAASTVRVRIAGLRGIWLPTVGSLQQLTYSGSASARADSFYYDAAAQAGVQTDGLRAGEQYDLTATTASLPDLQSLRAPGTDPQVAIPESVKTWMQQQDAGTGGAALATLVERLRARGYLSHALSVPADGAAWVQALGPGYVFQPIASGHSLARIDTMFRKLLTSAGDPSRSLVAAVGDDEQFSVAVALMAQELGFPARVVVGARLVAGADVRDVPACAAGVCTGGNITAWTEVRSADGRWVPVDVTPQHAEGADIAVAHRRDPENATDVRPQHAREVDPPDPTRQEAADAAAHPDDAGGLPVLWAALRAVGIGAAGLLILVGPFAAIVAAKAVRRRRRRRDATPAARMIGGWDEYVDTAVDHGLAGPGIQTRSELAAAHDSPAAATLAAGADRAVFSDSVPDAAQSERFWRIVDAERRRLSESTSVWRRMLAAVSLRSFVRGLESRPGHADRARTKPGTERRGSARSRAVPAQP
ncbi:transglutaminase-like domain-containing protein [Microbacterium kribbense]|uniref:Transglutaminase-like domain-containing protein n=1 Tax=Microbacterium kribbense TaxID=433645 RepID=A0ABP7GT69_9MICO